MTMKYKRNSPKLVMRITSVPQLLTCTKAPSPETAPFDLCHGMVSGINKICIRSSSYCRSQATAAYGPGSNTGMGFLRTNDLSEIKTSELNLDFGVWLKTRKWMVCN